jgi:Arc/MetJ-type ribon-helix-helix transcriptional regulator
MANVEKISVALTPEMAAMLRERRQQRAATSAWLGDLWDKELASGEPVSGSEAMAALAARFTRGQGKA